MQLIYTGIAVAKKTYLLHIQELVQQIHVLGNTICKAWPPIKTISPTTKEWEKPALNFINQNPHTTFHTS